MSGRVSSRTSRSARGQSVIAVVYVLGGLFLAAAMAWPVFETSRLFVIAGVAGASGIAIALVARAQRWPLWLTTLVVAGVYLAGVVPLAVPAGLRSVPAFLGGLRDGVIGIVIGWKQLLTLETPVGEYQAVLVPFFAVVLVIAVVATSIATMRGRRSGLAVPVVLAGGAFGLAFGRTDPGAPAEVAGLAIPAPREVVIGVLMVALSLVWLVVSARLERRAALAKATSTTAMPSGGIRSLGTVIRRRLLAGGLLVVALVVGIAAVPTFADVTPRSTLRTGVEPLLVIRDVSSPLGQYRAWFETDAFDVPLFTIAGDTTGIERIGIATLDAWDGREFRVGAGPDDARFTRVPTTAGALHALEISIDGYAGIWMPLPAGIRSAPRFLGPRAEELTDGFFLDRASGAGVDIAGTATDRGLRPGDAYRVEVPPTEDVTLGEPAATGALPLDRYPELSGWIAAQEQPRTAAGLAELLARLRDRGYLSHSLAADAASRSWIAALEARAPYAFHSSYAGHSAARIEALFRELREQQNRVGTDAADLLVSGVGDDEQFAAAGALVARALGYDSRVVVGVRLAASPGSGVAACDGTCTGGNMAAWIDVRSPGDTAWTTFDVEPQFARQPTTVSLGQELPKHPTAPEQAKIDTAQPPTSQRDDGETGVAVTEPAPEWLASVLRVLRGVALGAATLLLLVLPLVVLGFAKRLRRRRRRTDPVAEIAIVGAWEDLVDTWTDFGVVAHGATRTERAAAVGSADAIRLAGVVDGSVFAAAPPPRTAVDEAWSLADATRRELAGSRGRWRSLLAAITPASFVPAGAAAPFRAAAHPGRPSRGRTGTT